jgi:hypothetical protein
MAGLIVVTVRINCATNVTLSAHCRGLQFQPALASSRSRKLTGNGVFDKLVKYRIMSARDEINAEDEALGPWPRRLLHVPSMTSFEWGPGNVYGCHQTPAYYAITYTWGRWRLKEGNFPHINAIDIHGVSWDIPRVNPERFTTD